MKSCRSVCGTCTGLAMAFLAVCLLFQSSALAQKPCCNIISINNSTGLVTAKINATGQQFQFTLNNRAQLPQLSLGQGVYVNLKTNQVSLDGRTTAGAIINSASSSSAPTPGAPADSNRTFYAVVTAIDAARATATARESSGPVFQFRIPSSHLNRTVKVGTKVEFSRQNGLSVQGLPPGVAKPFDIHVNIDCKSTPQACPGYKPNSHLVYQTSFWADLQDFCNDDPGRNCTNPQP